MENRAAFADADRDAARTAEVAREHAEAVFDTQKLVADRVNDELGEFDAAAIRRNELALHGLFRRMIADLPSVQSFLVIDSTGHALVATGAYPVDHSISYADRDYFIALEAGGPPTFLSRLQVSRIDGQPFFGLGRRRDGPGGGFQGVIDVAVSPGFFQGFWETLVGEEGPDRAGTVVTLIRSDGRILGRYPPFPSRPPRVGPSTPFIAAIRRAPTGGSYLNRSVIDADRPERRFVYKQLTGYPVYVVVGRSTSSVLAAWRRTVLPQLLFGAPATAALFLVTLTALRRTRREHVALAQLRGEMQRREAAEAGMLQVQRMEAVGQLTSGVAHDFNNLLTVVMGSLELIEGAPERHDRVRRLAASGIIAVRRGADLTSKLLSFSRRQMTRPEIVDLNRLVGDFGPVLRQGATEAVSIALDLADGLPPVRLDAGQLEAAVLNLVANARDAMPSGGEIRIGTSLVTLTEDDVVAIPSASPGRRVCVAVADEGGGMDPNVALRAFEPFFTTKDVGKGTGLGLSQVYGFCQQAGGFARIFSVPGHGTTVDMFLPPAEPTDLPETATLAPSALPPSSRAAAGEVVLVVEDEPGVLEVAVQSLSELGYTTLTATDAASALDRLRAEQRIDIMFSDVVMPGRMNGVQLAREARRMRPSLKVLLTTGYTSERRVPDDVLLLAKPYRCDELASRLRMLSGK